jgi:hypothetical protein
LRIQADVAAIFQYINSVLLENFPQPPRRKVKALGDFFKSEDLVPHANTLVHRFIQLMQLSSTSSPRFPGEGRDPLLPWAPAFAGVAGLV